MRILVLGGTVFLSKEVATEAVRRGHEVVCVCRGVSGSVPPGATLARWDRATEPLAPTEAAAPDAVIDVARHPSWVRSAVAAFPEAHWVFVSTISVYADNSVPDGRPGTVALLEPVTTDEDPTSSPEMYGAMKVGCEQLVTDGVASAMIVRPGLISGPEDPTSRFGYWPERLAGGGEILVGGSAEDTVQIIDVRDLAAWIVDSAEHRRTGVYDGVGPVMPFGELLAEVADGVGVESALTWAPSDFLEAHDVETWAGDRSLPLWLPRPEYDGMLSHDVIPSLEAGLTIRPVADTARDTLAWLRAHPDANRTGISREAEAEVLAAWHARPEAWRD